MLDQLLQLAEEQLKGISNKIPELNDLDSKQVTGVTSQTIVNMIMQQARKGNVDTMKEMLSGTATNKDHQVIHKMKEPVANMLQNKLNISDESSKQLAVTALQIILNMLNQKVQSAETGGIDINNSINTISGKGDGILSTITGLFGGQSQNTKLINNIFQNLIH